MLSKRLALSLFSFAFASGVYGESQFLEPHNSEATTKADPPKASIAVGQIELPQGFKAQVFASEPDVNNPIGMAWDHKGRIWIAENYTYAERSLRFDFKLSDRIVILHDKDGDGISDSRKVFHDNLKALTSVEVGRGGVWAMCPPHLVFIPDANGDDIPDGEPEVMLDGFDIPHSNYHNFANGLKWGPDGWLYGRCGHSSPGKIGIPGTKKNERIKIKGGIWRYHPDRKVFEVLSHGTTNPWGHDWNKYGELFFINTVNGFLWHSIPGIHFKETSGSDLNPGVYERVNLHADHYHFDTSGRWTESRGGKANNFGGGHAHIGAMIYQADQWPKKWHDKLFTLNMHGLRANVEKLERHGSGYIGRHQEDAFVTKDKWFRGLDISQGPNGQVYMLDWSDIGECHDHTGVHRKSGRIYKLSFGESQVFEGLNFSTLTEKEVLQYLNEPNVWYERQFRNYIGSLKSRGEGLPQNLIQVMKGLLSSHNNAVVKLRALWALYACESLSEKELLSLLSDPHEAVRSWGIKLLLDKQPIDAIDGLQSFQVPDAIPAHLLNELKALAKKDVSGLVRLTLASSLQRLNIAQRTSLASELLKRTEDKGDQNIPNLVWTGLTALRAEHLNDLVNLVKQNHWPSLLKWASRSLSEKIEEKPEFISRFLQESIQRTSEEKEAIFMGLTQALKGWRSAKAPKAWPTFMASLSKSENEKVQEALREVKVVFGDGVDLLSIEKMVLNRKEDLKTRQSGLKTLIQSQWKNNKKVCEVLLKDKGMQFLAVKGLAQFSDEEIGLKILKRLRVFKGADREGVIDVLISRPKWAIALLKEIKSGTLNKSELSAFQARQMTTFNDKELNGLLQSVWGATRETSEDKLKWIKTWKTKLTADYLKTANLSQGRLVFQQICSSCHKMYGEGGVIGPDLTGSGRADLDYLLGNIADPSGEVSKDYLMTTISLKDGRYLSGVIVSENEKTYQLKNAIGGIEVINKSDISNRTTSSMSMMPEGLLQVLKDEQVRNLIAYLQHSKQVPLD